VSVSIDVRRTAVKPEARLQAFDQILARVRSVRGVRSAAQAFARRYLGNRPAVGQTFAMERTLDRPEPPAFHIVGFVKDTKYEDLREHFTPIAYLPVAQESELMPFIEIVVRADVPLASLTPALTRARRRPSWCRPPEPPPHISICSPNSTTRSGGIPKYAVAVVALRDINANNLSRHSAIPGRAEAIMVSRPRKNVVCDGSNGGNPWMCASASACGMFGSSMKP
jgi:hypothetical protein